MSAFHPLRTLSDAGLLADGRFGRTLPFRIAVATRCIGAIGRPEHYSEDDRQPDDQNSRYGFRIHGRRS